MDQQANPKADNGTKANANLVAVLCPPSMSTEVAQQVFNLGMDFLELRRVVLTGRPVISFAQLVKAPSGEQGVTVSHFVMLATEPNDVQRLLKLAQQISEANASEMKAKAGNAVDAAAAAIKAKADKAKAEAASGGPIIVT